MAETSASAGPVCLCGCIKAQHRQGRKSCLKCDCGEYDPATEAEPPAAVEAKAALHDMEVAFHHAERELKALRAVVADVRHATGLGDLATNLPRTVDDIRETRDRARAESAKLGEELAGALQRLAEYDSGASVDRLLHDADAIDLDRVRSAAAATRTAASILGDVLATAERELQLRAELQRLRDEAERVDERIRRLVAGEAEPGADPAAHEEAPSAAVDLMAALKASLERPRATEPEPAAAPELLADGEPRPADVRRWAWSNRFECPRNGPIPGGVLNAYKQARGLVSL